MDKTITAALAGNPNCGKTALFNQITGARQRVGNFSGVTVARKEGVVTHKGWTIRLVDLPGVYSCSTRSMEEIVTRDYILKEQPDLAEKLSQACAVLKQELLDPSSVSSLTGRLKRRVVLD